MKEELYYDKNAVDIEAVLQTRRYSDIHIPMREMEILSPASASTYKEAVHGGADAIYFGYGEFNARASADNFTTSLTEVVSYCHFYNVKAFLALNIAFKESELESVVDIIKEAERAQIDAFIIADLTLVPLIKQYSDAQIHASTQLGIHNVPGVNFAYNMGFDRAVLSREVNLSELKKIGYCSLIDLEFFIHGALCVSFSGACLLSSMLTGNSGNRGRCNQLCRKFYHGYLEGNEVMKGYLLSAKDLCFADYLKDLNDCNIYSCKIEGRLRRAEYVAGTAAYYHSLKQEKDPPLSDDELKVLFNRGDFTPGYFAGNNVIYPYSPAHIGFTVGKVVKLINPHTALVKCNSPLKRQNGYKLMRRDEEVSGCLATGEVKDNLSVIFCSEIIKIGDCVHLTSDIDLKNIILSGRKKFTVILDISIVGGERPTVKMMQRGRMTEYTFDFIADQAQKLPLSEDEIKAQFDKTSDTAFIFRYSSVYTENAFLTKAQLNAMRRKIIEIAEQEQMAGYKRMTTSKTPCVYLPTDKIHGHFAEVRSIDALSDKLFEYIPNIVYSPEVFDLDDCKEFYEKAKKNNLVWIKPPLVLSERLVDKCKSMIECFDGVVCENVGMIELAKSLGKYTVAGWSLNIFNKYNPLIDICENYVISTELNRYEVRSLPGGMLYTYGFLPLMNLSFCPRRQMGITCDNCYGKVEYRDEKGTYLVTTSKMEKGKCRHQLRNALLTDIGNDYQKDMYFDFTVLNEPIEEVLCRYFEQGIYNPIGANKLHLNRGVK